MSFFNLNQPENDLSLPQSSILSPLSNPEERVFSCNYCRRKFYSSQALGGHQNAHKIERNLAKKNRALSSAVKTHSTFNQPASRTGPGGTSHNTPVMIGIDNQDHVGRFIASDQCSSRGVDYSYKGERVEEDFGHLDLSLRL